jgi:hypothetical protein
VNPILEFTIGNLGCRVAPVDVAPFLLGLAAGSLYSVDVTVDGGGGARGIAAMNVDPSGGDQAEVYLVQLSDDAEASRICAAWVIPWVRGLAAFHGIDLYTILDRSAAERARRIQALMIGHQRGWFTYHGFN